MTDTNPDAKFARFFFTLVTFLLIFGTVGYALFSHNWSLLIGEICGIVGTVLANAIKDANKKDV